MRLFVSALIASGYLMGAVASASTAVECGSGSRKSGQVLGVNGTEVLLRATPSASGTKLVNEKATRVLGRTMYLQIDNSTTVLEECTQGDWSRVRVQEPDWLRNSHIGWVETRSLRKKKTDAQGVVVFTDADFHWDKRTAPYKNIVIAGVNKVHRENERCKTIDPTTATRSPSKGSADDPVFFVTCGRGASAFNAYFSKSEVERGTKLVAAQHIDHLRALDLCEGYARANAVHPSTVDFSRFMDFALSNHPNGRTTVTSSFTAKNRFNLELKHNIRCLLDANGLIEAHITEAR